MSDAPPDWGGYEPPESFTFDPLLDIEERPIIWNEYPFLQGSAFHLLAGIKNAGKGTWLCHTAARVTRGELGPKRQVLWLAMGEDSYAIDVRPRLRAAGAELDRVTVMRGHGFQLPRNVDQLKLQAELHEAGMIIIDPVGGAFGGKTSTNADSDVRPVLQCLNILADETETMVFGVRHISIKATRRQEGALGAILGSSDFVNIPRAVIVLVLDDVDAQLRHLYAATGNRGPSDTPGLMFRVEGVVLDGHVHEVTRVRVLGSSIKDMDELLVAKRTRATTKTDNARELVLTLLLAADDHQMESSEINVTVAERTGLGAGTVINVRNDLRAEGLLQAIPVRDGFAVSMWMNKLTEAGVRKAEGVTAQVDHPDHLDHLDHDVGSNTPRTSPSTSKGTFPRVLGDLGDLGAHDLGDLDDLDPDLSDNGSPVQEPLSQESNFWE